MGVHQQGYYTTHIPASAAPSESQAALVTFAVTDTKAHTLARAHSTVLPLLYSSRMCDKSLRACQSWRAQRCMQAVQAVNDLSVCTGPPGWPLRGCSDKTGHILTPVGLRSLLSGVSVSRDAAVSKYFDSLTMAWLRRGWRWTQLTARRLHPELIHPAKTSVLSLG